MPHDSSEPGWMGRPGWSGLPPHAQPFVHALNRMQARETVRPDQMEARARGLLDAHFGPGEEATAAFARGGAGLISEHSHYFDGFALMLPLAQGTAVALRPARGRKTSVVFDAGAVEVLGEAPASPPLRVVAHVLDKLERDAPVEMAAVSSIAPAFQDAMLSSLGVALSLAVAPDLGRHARLAALAAALEGALYPFSLAYPIAALEGQPGTYTLVDTRTYEQAPLEALPAPTAAWGLVDPGGGVTSPARGLALRRRAHRALENLQQHGMAQLTSFRYLEHQDLPGALARADARHRPTIQYLVTENRRVMNFVRAVRQQDAQMMGTILLSSFHARSEWEGTQAREDRAIAEAEAMLFDGIFGASLTGHGRSVLVFGQPASLPLALDRIAAAGTREMQPPATMLL